MTKIKALVVRASINEIIKWRVYFAGELLATFENETDAIYYANFIDRQWWIQKIWLHTYCDTNSKQGIATSNWWRWFIADYVKARISSRSLKQSDCHHRKRFADGGQSIRKRTKNCVVINTMIVTSIKLEWNESWDIPCNVLYLNC